MSTTIISNTLSGNVGSIAIVPNLTQVTTSGTSITTIADITIAGGYMPNNSDQVTWAGFSTVSTGVAAGWTFQFYLNGVSALTHSVSSTTGTTGGSWECKLVRKDSSNCLICVTLIMDKEVENQAYEFGQLAAAPISLRVDASVNNASNSITSLYNVLLYPQ
jgi:hypothetical protein